MVIAPGRTKLIARLARLAPKTTARQLDKAMRTELDAAAGH